jgi:hypothetical protein
MEDDTNSFDEMEDDMDFRAIERLSADQLRESIYHPPSYLRGWVLLQVGFFRFFHIFNGCYGNWRNRKLFKHR